MFKFNSPLELPPQLEWKFAHEPELLGWTIRARNYNTVVANGMFYGVALLLIAVVYGMYSVYEGMGQPWRTLSCIVFYMIALSVASSITHQRVNIAFRLSGSGLEYCKWRDFPKWALSFLKWLTGVTAVIFVFMATIDISFLLGALVGPGGMGLTYLAMANSKSYQEMQTEYNHHEFKWSEFTQLAIATNREVVDLKYSVPLEGGGTMKWSLNVFCKRNQKEKVAEFIRPYLSPNVPFIRAKVNVPLSTD